MRFPRRWTDYSIVDLPGQESSPLIGIEDLTRWLVAVYPLDCLDRKFLGIDFRYKSRGTDGEQLDEGSQTCKPKEGDVNSNRELLRKGHLRLYAQLIRESNRI